MIVNYVSSILFNAGITEVDLENCVGFLYFN